MVYGLWFDVAGILSLVIIVVSLSCAVYLYSTLCFRASVATNLRSKYPFSSAPSVSSAFYNRATNILDFVIPKLLKNFCKNL